MREMGIVVVAQIALAKFLVWTRHLVTQTKSAGPSLLDPFLFQTEVGVLFLQFLDATKSTRMGVLPDILQFVAHGRPPIHRPFSRVPHSSSNHPVWR